MCYWISVMKKCEIVLYYRTSIGRQDLYEELLSVGPREKALIIRIILTMSGEDTATLAGGSEGNSGTWGSWVRGSQRPSHQLGWLGEHCKLPQWGPEQSPSPC